MNIETVREFRGRIKEAFDVAEGGETVSVYRGGKRYLLVCEDAVREAKAMRTKQFAQEYDSEPIEGYNARDERALPNTTVTTSELGELPCCAGARPCKHWVWDTATGEGYRNSLSGRLREAS